MTDLRTKVRKIADFICGASVNENDEWFEEAKDRIGKPFWWRSYVREMVDIHEGTLIAHQAAIEKAEARGYARAVKDAADFCDRTEMGISPKAGGKYHPHPSTCFEMGSGTHAGMGYAEALRALTPSPRETRTINEDHRGDHIHPAEQAAIEREGE